MFYPEELEEKLGAPLDDFKLTVLELLYNFLGLVKECTWIEFADKENGGYPAIVRDYPKIDKGIIEFILKSHSSADVFSIGG